MHYKAVKGTETFKKLKELEERIIFVDKKAQEFVRIIGGDKFCHDRNNLAGGVIAVEFTDFNKSPIEGWKKVGKGYQQLYYPKASNKKALELLNSLPIIDNDELNKIVGFKAPQTYSSSEGLCWISRVAINFGEEAMLISVPMECKYTPPTDLCEILESEYLAIKKQNEEEKASSRTKATT